MEFSASVIMVDCIPSKNRLEGELRHFAQILAYGEHPSIAIFFQSAYFQGTATSVNHVAARGPIFALSYVMRSSPLRGV